ncbi:MAG: hypothetical protein EOP05_05985 [Proteobacteria bacterium]|nr:MAG: hypothetical protein EOP05_05985 [Pseudomonadota bacterium]
MFRLSERSQVGRLKSLLEELKYSGNGKTGTFATAPTTPQRREMTSTLEFVCKRKGGEALKTLLNVDFTLTGDSGYGGYGCEYDQGLAAKALRSAGTFPAYNYGSGTSYDDDKLTLSFAGELKQNLSLKNQGLILNEIKVWDYTPKSENGIQLVNKSEATKWNVNSHVLTLMLEKQPPVSFDLKLIVKALRKESPEALDAKNTFDPNKLNPSQTQPYIVENESGTLVVTSIRVDTHPKSEAVELTNLDGLVLTKPTSQTTDRSAK